MACAGTRCRQLSSHLVPAEVPTANFRPAIFCRRSPAAAYSLGIKSLVEVPGRARDGSEEERRSGRDGTATAATCPAVLRGEPDARRAARGYPRSALVVRPEPRGGQIIRQAAGHRQVADEMRQRVDAADEAAERTAFA